MQHANLADTGLAASGDGAEAPPRWCLPVQRQGHAMLRAVCAIVLAWMACASQAQVIVAASAFETDRDGWTMDILDPVATACCSNPLWQGSGGSPGGFIWAALFPDSFAFNAPAKFLGDMSAVLGGSLKFEQSLRAGGAPASRQPWVVISDGTLALQWMGTGPASADWSSYAVDFNVRAGWQVVPAAFGEDGNLATQGQLRQVLSDLKLLRIAIGPPTATGLDQVRLLAPVPEPAPAALWMAGLGAWAWLRRHRRPV